MFIMLRILRNISTIYIYICKIIKKTKQNKIKYNKIKRNKKKNKIKNKKNKKKGNWN